jgi:hypothetical protein
MMDYRTKRLFSKKQKGRAEDDEYLMSRICAIERAAQLNAPGHLRYSDENEKKNRDQQTQRLATRSCKNEHSRTESNGPGSWMEMHIYNNDSPAVDADTTIVCRRQ